MRYHVYLATEAEDDLLEIYRYVALADSVQKTDLLIAKLEETIQKLETSPRRGHVPPELERIDVFDYREIHFKPYRIVYEISRRSIFVHAVLDGRRDLQDVLQKRLLR